MNFFSRESKTHIFIVQSNWLVLKRMIWLFLGSLSRKNFVNYKLMCISIFLIIKWNILNHVIHLPAHEKSSRKTKSFFFFFSQKHRSLQHVSGFRLGRTFPSPQTILNSSFLFSIKKNNYDGLGFKIVCWIIVLTYTETRI